MRKLPQRGAGRYVAFKMNPLYGQKYSQFWLNSAFQVFMRQGGPSGLALLPDERFQTRQ